MALSSNSKKGLALGALLPVLLSVYSESRERAETQAQRASAHNEARQKHREAVQARDLDSAQKFLVQVTGDSADPQDSRRDGSFCDHVYIASELVRLTSQSTATQAAVVGALQYRSEEPRVDGAKAAVHPASLPPRICDCPATLEQMQSNWRPGKKGTLADTGVIREMATTLDSVASKCDDDEGDKSGVTNAVVPAPVAGVEAPTRPGRLGPASPADVPKEAPRSVAGSAAVPAPAKACADTPPDDGTPIRVYIQIASDEQRAAATALQGKLRGSGYIVPGIERVGTSASPAKMQVRYVFSEDCGSADRLREDVAMASRQPVPPELLPPLGQYRSHSLRRSFEIWFPKR